jgi:type I restriction enzyme M protein
VGGDDALTMVATDGSGTVQCNLSFESAILFPGAPHRQMLNHQEHANLIWQIADLLRGPYRPAEYERVMLPMTVLRRLDCVLAGTKAKVLTEYRKRRRGTRVTAALESKLNDAAGQPFHNHSRLTFNNLRAEPSRIRSRLTEYINGFSENVSRIFRSFEFDAEIDRMSEHNILHLVVSKFSEIDLHPRIVENAEMGLIFENLIHRFSELANETAGDHFTPREVIRLMVRLLFIHDQALLRDSETKITLLDPACGTGGMLAEAQRYLRDSGLQAKLFAYGQEYNKRTYAIAASDMLIKHVDPNGKGENVKFGDSLTHDQFEGDSFDYFLSNPPFGVVWKRQQDRIRRERQSPGYNGRFVAGLPRVSDGSFLFLQHMVNKFDQQRGSRLAIVLSGSPMFTGGAGSGESDIRKWIIEADLLEAIVALPEQMFYNTAIGTYIWIVTNRKERRRERKIQLVDARGFYIPMPRSMGDKRRRIGEGVDGQPDQIDEILRLYEGFTDGEKSRTLSTHEFGYTRVTVERPLRLRYKMTVEGKNSFLDAYPRLLDDIQAIDKAFGREPHRNWDALWALVTRLLGARKSRWTGAERDLFRTIFTTKDPGADPVRKQGSSSGWEPDPELRDFENVPLAGHGGSEVESFFQREVRPNLPDAWLDRTNDKVGYEINFNRFFYPNPMTRSLEVIDRDLRLAKERIVGLLEEVTK